MNNLAGIRQVGLSEKGRGHGLAVRAEGLVAVGEGGPFTVQRVVEIPEPQQGVQRLRAVGAEAERTGYVMFSFRLMD